MFLTCYVVTDRSLSLIKGGTDILVILYSIVAHELRRRVGSMLYVCIALVQ